MKYTPNPMQTNDITLSDDLVALTELIAANGFSVADYSDQADHKKKLSKQHKKNSRMILQLGTKQHRCNRSQSPDQAKHSNYNSLRIVVLIITHIFPVPLTLLR